jgi:hypothetical protein
MSTRRSCRRPLRQTEPSFRHPQAAWSSARSGHTCLLMSSATSSSLTSSLTRRRVQRSCTRYRAGMRSRHATRAAAPRLNSGLPTARFTICGRRCSGTGAYRKPPGPRPARISRPCMTDTTSPCRAGPCTTGEPSCRSGDCLPKAASDVPACVAFSAEGDQSARSIVVGLGSIG